MSGEEPGTGSTPPKPEALTPRASASPTGARPPSPAGPVRSLPCRWPLLPPPRPPGAERAAPAALREPAARYRPRRRGSCEWVRQRGEDLQAALWGRLVAQRSPQPLEASLHAPQAASRLKSARHGAVVPRPQVKLAVALGDFQPEVLRAGVARAVVQDLLAASKRHVRALSVRDAKVLWKCEVDHRA